MLQTIMVGVLSILLGTAPGLAQRPTTNPSLGFLSLTTAQESDRQDGAEKFAPNVLVRFTRTDGDYKVFAMTDQSGTAIVPLEPGFYCAKAFGLDGKVIQLTPRSLQKAHSCFTLKADTTVELSLTIIAGASYSKKIPQLAVQ